MAPQDKLVKVGTDDFALLDDFCGRYKKPAGPRVPTTTSSSQVYDHYHRQHYNNNNQQQYVYKGPQAIVIREPIIDSNEAARFYGGISIVDHSVRKPIRRVY